MTAVEVAEGVYLSSMEAAHDEAALKALGITHILNTAGEVESKFFAGVEYKDLGLSDSVEADIDSCFYECLMFISSCLEAKGKILVHSRWGVHRAPTIVMVWLMNTMSLDEAYTHVKALKPDVEPHHSFFAALMNLESSK
eukprot:TRINITY_DN887_c0_g1_i2.p1 TRINITY_DN887_c0_g1~~TRINITY_DN887_c0_g1_i2.p1  ORF type:complete len:140 (+),score=26.54 TRINITY_DN887_c0_g1_i2:189-608(+)